MISSHRQALKRLCQRQSKPFKGRPTAHRSVSTTVANEPPPITDDTLDSLDEDHTPSKPPRKLLSHELQSRWASVKPLMDSYANIPSPKSIYKAHHGLHQPPSPHSLTLQHMIDANLHLGHSTQLWHPSTLSYIYGIRAGIHIINLSTATLPHLRRACAILQDIAMRNGLILFIGTREGSERAVVKAAQRSNGYHITKKWVPGTLTNASEILGSRPGASPESIAKPDIIVVMNPLENEIAIKEATAQRIPSIALVDTDMDARKVTYAIPGNDDSTRGVELVLGVLSKAAEQGLQMKKAADDLHHRQQRMLQLRRQRDPRPTHEE